MKINSVLFIIFLVADMNTIPNKSTKDDLDDEKANKNVTIALLQLKSYGADLSENLKIGDAYCRKAKEMGADIVLFPEMWSIGYSRYHWPGSRYTPDKFPISFKDWHSKAVSHDDLFIVHFKNLAKELGMTIIITYLEKWKPLPRNSASVITADGNILMTYAKVHTSDMITTESNCTPGDDFFVCDLSVNDDTFRLGIMTCFDREHPESARILMLKGAELILTPNACILDDRRINQFQTRAFENAVGVAMANYAGPSQNGRSCAFDCDGNKLLVSGEEEGIFLVEFDLQKIKNYRSRTSWGNAFRRPHKYKMLTSPDIDSVFMRNNGLGERFNREER